MNARTLSLLLHLLCAGVLVRPVHADVDVLRVRLFSSHLVTHVELVADGGSLTFFIDHTQTLVGELAQGERAGVYLRDDELYAALPGGGIYALAMRVEPSDGARIRISRMDNHVLHEAHVFEGAIALRADPGPSDGLFVVNEVDLETYVAAVVHREYGMDQLEGAKAVAVAARTYALATRGRHGAGYDVRDDEGSQVYRGSYGVHPSARQAAEETAGEVLVHGNRPIEAVHFASSGGHTVDNERVWAAPPLPYLRGKPDPYDEHPERSWQTTLLRDSVLAVLAAAFGEKVEGFLIGQRGRDGRADSVALLLPADQRLNVSGNAFRLALNRAFGSSSVPSTNFTAVRRDDAYLFEGIGFGHGVGLPQWSAYGMARRNHTYKEILAYYYAGTRITRLEHVALREEAPGAPPTSQPTQEGEKESEVTAVRHAPSITSVPLESYPSDDRPAPVDKSAPSQSATPTDPAPDRPARTGW